MRACLRCENCYDAAMSKNIFLGFCGAFLMIGLASCGGTKGGMSQPGMMEYDEASGSWKPTSRVVAAPPPAGGAVITEQKKPGMMKKVGDTLKKPLKWVGLAKDEPEPAPAPQAGSSKPAAKP